MTGVVLALTVLLAAPPAGPDPVPAADLATDGAPDAVAVQRLVGVLRARDAVAREAAIRRLLPHPGLAAGPVADAFAEGNLQTRLAALELLRAWQAPVAGLDPWRPDTLTAPRLRDLRHWAADPGKGAAPAAELTAEERESARREIARLLQATDAETAAVRERLARHGRALLPEVTEQLRQASTDLARERLTALRYRLVSPGALALTWPGGLERLASMNAAVRRPAAQELAGRATAADEPLLLELFASPDPLVRETALRALQEVAGPRATAALTGLLHDPDPNVRAAVLKQLAEQPSPGMARAVAAYVAEEKDPDLLVHAVRALREARADVAVECLKGLLAHDSWRVRAEAAEGLGKVMSQNRNPETDADICVALIRLLDDPDGFVVSRAVAGLKTTGLASAVEPLVRAARAHPELTVEVIKTVSSGNMAQKAVPHLRAFCAHEDPDVRAAAVTGLYHSAVAGAEKELRAALRDKSGKVRRAAAQALLDFRSTLRSPPRHGMPPPPPDRPERPRAAKDQPEWLKGFPALLRPLLAADDPEERLDGALALIAFAEEQQALPVLVAAARARPALQDRAAEALPWLPWPRRRELFDTLVALGPGPETLAVIVRKMTEDQDRRAIPRFWELTAADGLTDEAVGVLLDGLLRLYFGDSLHTWSDNVLQVSAADQKEAAADARPRAAAGPELPRLLALAVLVTAAPEDAAAAAEKLMADSAARPALRRDAFQVLLVSQSAVQRRRSAVNALAHPDPAIRELAVEALARGMGPFQALRDGHIPLHPVEELATGDGNPGDIIVPEAPRGLEPGPLRPLLRDPNPKVAACAGYLLALLGEPEGLGPLLQYWRAQPRTDDVWVRLVYRAVAALGDDSRVPLLEEIYRGLPHDSNWQLREFYWTIRVLDGPNALRLRKQIRHEVGMESLR